MKMSRRAFASALGAGALARAAGEAETQGPVSKETVLALLDAQGPRGIFDEPEWLELLARAIEQSIETREILRRYPIPDDVEPALTFRRD